MNENIKKYRKEKSKLKKFFKETVKKGRQTKITRKSCILHRANNES